jgi:hypothetical protein
VSRPDDDRLDELYREPPDKFVAARNAALRRRLKEAKL